MRKAITFFADRSQQEPTVSTHRLALGLAHQHVALCLLPSGTALEEVEKLARHGLAHGEPVARSTDDLLNLGENSLAISWYWSQRKEYAKCLSQLDDAERLLRRGLALESTDARSHRRLADVRLVRALCLLSKEEFLKALESLDAAIGPNLDANPNLREVAEKIVFRVQEQMVTHEREGRAPESLAAARILVSSRLSTGVALYESACILSKQSARLPSPPDREPLAALAVSALREAFRRGFKSGLLWENAFRGQHPLDYMQMDRDLEPLRIRPDYQLLVKEQEAVRTRP
jgi:tetratricopeptide (TPR) repeat protein